MSAELIAYDFHESRDGLFVPAYHRPPGSTDVLALPLGPLRAGEWVDDRDVEEKIKEIAMNRRVLERGDDTFDISTVTDNDPKKPYMIHMSTYGSSLDNPGNAWEFAVQCLLHPDYNHVYVASFANGASSAVPESDMQREWFEATGRLTRPGLDGNTEPLQIVINLYRGLSAQNINMIRVMGADSAGVSASRALAMAMEPGQLESAVFSGATGFRSMSTSTIAAAMLVREQIINGFQNARLGKRFDQYGMTSDKIERARKIMEEHTPDKVKQGVNAHHLKTSQIIRSRIVTAHGLRRGPNDMVDPLVEETDAIASRHPNANMWYIMGERDPLYGGPQYAHASAVRFLTSVVMSNMNLGVVMAPEMTHAFHTYLPRLKFALAKAALDVQV